MAGERVHTQGEPVWVRTRGTASHCCLMWQMPVRPSDAVCWLQFASHSCSGVQCRRSSHRLHFCC